MHRPPNASHSADSRKARAGNVPFILVLLSAILTIIPPTRAFGWVLLLLLLIPASIVWLRARELTDGSRGLTSSTLVIAVTALVLGTARMLNTEAPSTTPGALTAPPAQRVVVPPAPPPVQAPAPDAAPVPQAVAPVLQTVAPAPQQRQKRVAALASQVVSTPSRHQRTRRVSQQQRSSSPLRDSSPQEPSPSELSTGGSSTWASTEKPGHARLSGVSIKITVAVAEVGLTV